PQNWLVIAGQQPVTLPMNDPMGREQALKKLTSLLGPPLSTFDVLERPRQFGRALHNELLGLEERLQRSCMVVRFPTRKVGKLNGLEDDGWAGHGPPLTPSHEGQQICRTTMICEATAECQRGSPTRFAQMARSAMPTAN